MSEPKDVIDGELRNRLARADALLKQGLACLEQRDFLQCAVRIELAAKEGKFSEFEMNLFDAHTLVKS